MPPDAGNAPVPPKAGNVPVPPKAGNGPIPPPKAGNVPVPPKAGEGMAWAYSPISVLFTRLLFPDGGASTSLPSPLTTD